MQRDLCKLKILLSIIIVLSQSHAICGQLITKTVNEKYHYDGNMYRYNELSTILESNELAFRYFNESKSLKRTANILNISAVSLMGLSTVLITGPPDIGYKSAATGLILFAGVGIPLLTVGLTKSSKVKYIQEKSIEQFNKGEAIGSRDKFHNYISYGVTPNGLGLTYHFK